MAKKSKHQLDQHNADKYTAFMLRFKGYSYLQISEEVAYSEQTLRYYFSKEGPWYDEYEDWAEAQVADIQKQVSDMFVAQALEAVQQVVNLSKGQLFVTVEEDGKKAVIRGKVKDSTVLKAAQDILDRAGFKAIERIQTDPINKADEMFDWLRNRKKEKAAAANE